MNVVEDKIKLLFRDSGNFLGRLHAKILSFSCIKWMHSSLLVEKNYSQYIFTNGIIIHFWWHTKKYSFWSAWLKRIETTLLCISAEKHLTMLFLKVSPASCASILREVKMDLMNTIPLSRCAFLTLCRNGCDSVKFRRLVTVRMKV